MKSSTRINIVSESSRFVIERLLGQRKAKGNDRQQDPQSPNLGLPLQFLHRRLDLVQQRDGGNVSGMANVTVPPASLMKRGPCLRPRSRRTAPPANPPETLWIAGLVFRSNTDEPVAVGHSYNEKRQWNWKGAGFYSTSGHATSPSLCWNFQRKFAANFRQSPNKNRRRIVEELCQMV